jgi:glycerophosphoryl diester phosphodiesterase
MTGPANRLPELIAHRGNAAEYPENTLPSLRSALDLGIRYIEFDVQLSLDRQPMLLNDSNLKRTAGVDRSALEMMWQELEEISVNEEARFQRRYTDVGIPSLAQAVSLIEAHPAATAFVELKRASLRTFGTELMARKVCEALKPIARQCVIVSFDLAAVHHVRQTSSYRVGWMLTEYSNLSALKCEALAPDYIFCDHQLLTQASAQLWRGPWRWAVYDVVSPRLAMELAARGVRLIQSTAVRTMLREFRGIRMRA